MSEYSRFSLFKRANGVYSILYYQHGHRRWKSTSATTKPEALAALSEFRQLLTSNKPTKSVRDFVQSFLTYAEATYAPKTLEIYRNALERFVRSVGGLFIPELTAEHLDRYKANRLKAVSPVSVNIEVRAIKAALNVAVRWELTGTNPFASVQQVRVAEQVPCYFTKSDFDKLLTALEGSWLRELVIFACATGMRQGEMLNLRWKDVDLTRKLIHIESSGTFKTKNGKRRTIPMSGVVHALLSGRATTSTGEYVFMRQGGKIGKSYLGHRFKAIVRDAGLSEKLHWHSLRHTHASYLVQSGVPILAVSKLLGHSSVNVTTKHYAALQPENLHDEVEKVFQN